MRHKLRVKIRKVKGKNVVTAMLLSVYIFFLSPAMAQESINATGSNATGSGGSASYSVGMLVYTTNMGTSGSVAQGVQQPFEISIVVGVEEAKGIQLLVSAYPNPTADFLQLKVDVSTTLNNQSLTYQLFDMNGKPLQTKKLTGTVTQIDMSSYVPSTYFVRVIKGNQSIKEFKIIKN